MTTPRTAACQGRGLRRSRRLASRAIGRKSAPAARFSWYHACQAMSDDRPKKAPAAIAPAWVGSNSRAARYIA